MNLRDVIKGKVLILGVDTLPLALTEDAPKTFVYDGVEYDIKDKCCRATALGTRTWQTANEIKRLKKEYAESELGKVTEEWITYATKDFITILVPDINYPGEQYIANKEFTIKSYDYKKATFNYSEELTKYINEHDTVIFPMIGGIGFHNFNLGISIKDKVLIYDGFENQLLSLPYALQNKDEKYKENYTQSYNFFYKNIIKRVDYILYCNEPMRYFFESQLYLNGRLGYDNFKESPLIKFPYILENKDLKIEKNKLTVKDNKLTLDENMKLLWYGPSYPWYDTKKLIDMIRDMKNVTLDFVAVKHPRYKNSYDESLFKNLPDNIKVIEEYQDERWEIYKQYDAGILLSKEYVENKYNTRCRLYDMLSYGLPIITNETTPIFKELEMEKEHYNLKKVIVERTIFNGMKKLSIEW